MFKKVKYMVLAAGVSLVAVSVEAGFGDLLKVVTEPGASKPDVVKQNTTPCPQCNGNGFVTIGFKSKKCKACSGSGIMLQPPTAAAPAAAPATAPAAVEAPGLEVAVCDDISMDDLKRQMRAHPGCLLLDVREPGEFSSGHIKGAVNVPVGQVSSRMGSVCADKSRHIYVYCQSGRRSRVAAQTLAGMGYKKVHNVLGGVSAWDGKLVD